MEVKKQFWKFFHWLDIKLCWLLHLPKPVNSEEFDRQLEEARKEDKIRTIAMIEAAKQAGRREVPTLRPRKGDTASPIVPYAGPPRANK